MKKKLDQLVDINNIKTMRIGLDVEIHAKVLRHYPGVYGNNKLSKLLVLLSFSSIFITRSTRDPLDNGSTHVRLSSIFFFSVVFICCILHYDIQ